MNLFPKKTIQNEVVKPSIPTVTIAAGIHIAKSAWHRVHQLRRFILSEIRPVSHAAFL